MDELFVGLTAAAASPPLASDGHGSYLNGTRLRTDQKASTLSEANPNPNPDPDPNLNPDPGPDPSYSHCYSHCYSHP